MKAFQLAAATVLIVAAAAFLLGCDVGVNPLLFDGSPGQATFRIDESVTSSYSGSVGVDLEDILSAIDDEIDSVKVFNITLLIDSTEGTNSSTTFTGTTLVNSTVMLSMSNTPMSAFVSERSIFDNTIPGLTYNSGIINTLHALLRDRPAPTVTVSFSGTSSPSGPLHFTAHLKLYTQVYTKAKN